MALTSPAAEPAPEGQPTPGDRSRPEARRAGAERRLEDLDAAELRREEGTYGVCEVCGRRIPLARLEVRPTARTCVDHAA